MRKKKSYVDWRDEESFVIIAIENTYVYSINKSNDKSYQNGLSRNPYENSKNKIKEESNIFILLKDNQNNNNIGNSLLTLSLLLFWLSLSNINIFDSSLILFFEFS